mmetsp:Transcript_10360/g.19057  ORF Transcript_10360/g.19057 Transcript_10360/m.19057 type:complete len:93 (-) Transcript_10360:114-392(-)
MGHIKTEVCGSGPPSGEYNLHPGALHVVKSKSRRTLSAIGKSLSNTFIDHRKREEKKMEKYRHKFDGAKNNSRASTRSGDSNYSSSSSEASE